VAGLRLVLLSGAHLPLLERTIADPDIVRNTRIPEPPPPGFAEFWLGRYEEGRAAGEREGFVVEDEDGRPLGLAVAPRIEREARTAELGYVVLAEERGRGVATEALRLLTDWAFAELGAVRLELMISVENDASKRVAERCGYLLEGVLRSLYVKPGRWEDTEVWSRLATDP
jgi:RimJ/RimL family protein N-acetyltransferase